MSASKLGACWRGDGGDGDVEHRIGIRPQMQPRVAQVPSLVFERDGLVVGEQPGDNADPVFQQPAGLARLQPDHDAVGRQRARAEAEHHPPARQMVEQHDALRDPKRIVIRDADHAGAELDMPRAFRGSGNHDFRRGGKFGAGGVVFAEPRFVIAAAIEPLDQFEIALQGERRVDAGLVEWCEENAEAQALAHGTVFPFVLEVAFGEFTCEVSTVLFSAKTF